MIDNWDFKVRHKRTDATSQTVRIDGCRCLTAVQHLVDGIYVRIKPMKSVSIKTQSGQLL